MTGSHHGNNIVMTGSQHKGCFSADRVVMTGSHHGKTSDDWQSSWEQW